MGLFQKCLTVLVTWSNRNSVLHSFLLGRVAELGGVRKLFRSGYNPSTCPWRKSEEEEEEESQLPLFFSPCTRNDDCLPSAKGNLSFLVDGPSQKDPASNGCLSTLLVKIILHIFCMSLTVSIKPRPFDSEGEEDDFCCGFPYRQGEEEAEEARGAGGHAAQPCRDSQAAVSANQSELRQPLLPTNQSSSSHLPANPSSGSLLPTNQSSDSQPCRPMGERGAGSAAGRSRPALPSLRWWWACVDLSLFCSLIFSWKHVAVFILTILLILICLGLGFFFGGRKECLQRFVITDLFFWFIFTFANVKLVWSCCII